MAQQYANADMHWKKLPSELIDLLAKKGTSNSKSKVRRDGHVSIISNMAEMRENGELCDYTISIDGKQISAHKCVLAASCEYFRAAFRFGSSSQPSTSSQAEPSSTLDLSHLGCRPDAVENVVCSFYTNEVALSPGTVQDVLLLADYLMYGELRECVEQFMLGSLDQHTASLYFQLARHYSLDTTSLQARASKLLQAHFHDYFIHQTDSITASLQIVQHYMQDDFFKFCSPLQMVEFFLTNLKATLETSEKPCSSQKSRPILEIDMVQHTSTLLGLLSTFATCQIDRWRDLVLGHIEGWTCEHVSDSNVSDLSDDLRWCLEKLRGFFLFEAEADVCAFSHHCAACSQREANGEMQPRRSAMTRDIAATVKEFSDITDDIINIMSNADGQHGDGAPSETGLVPQNSAPPLNLGNGDASGGSQSLGNAGKPKQCVGEPPGNLPASDSPSGSRKILVLLAPSAEMASQLMATDEEEYRPLVRSPQLEVSLYDIEMMVWRSAGTLDLPVSGALLDKHAWRIAFLDNCLYMFSLVKRAALEYNVVSGEWTSLPCKDPFLPHGEQQQSHVKSLIPIAVAGRLVVLSMSKQCEADNTYSTEQRFYEMDPETKSFSLVQTVDDYDMELPITQWTVSGDVLITVKASATMFRQLSRLQYIHCYNARTRTLATHKVFCTMESGIKLMVQGSSLYLLDRSGWCRTFDLDSGDWTGMVRYPKFAQSRGTLSVSDPSEVNYPALTRVTCHVDQSRWQVNTSLQPARAHLEELHVGRERELGTLTHTPPPFQFVTAMCPASMDAGTLRSLRQARFEYLDLEGVSLDAQECPNGQQDQWLQD